MIYTTKEMDLRDRKFKDKSSKWGRSGPDSRNEENTRIGWK
jgi:hypothetical protein